MKPLKSITNTGKKVVAGFFVVTLFLVVVAGLTYVTLNRLAGSVQQTYLGEAAHDFGLDVDWVVVDSMDAALAATAAGEADAMATNHFFGAQFARERGLGETPILFDPSRLYYASARGANADLLRAIDLHLARWQGRADSPYFATLRQWKNTFRNTKSIGGNHK